MLDWGSDRLPARFWDKVHPEPNSGCWLWRGTMAGSGYGQFLVAAKPMSNAHRVAWQAAFQGPLPLIQLGHVDHLCRTPLCVNPDHLELVTPKENMLRGRNNLDNGACRSGLHPITCPADIYVSPQGRRNCRECRKLAAKRFADKKRSVR